MLDPVDGFLAGYSPDIQAISRALCSIVRRAMPREAHEVVFARHNHIGYGMTELLGDRICYICPMKGYVRLGFMIGGYLPDPDQRLQGEGKRLRHVKVRTVAAAGDPALARLVEAAWADAEARMPKAR
jgi:Domain of unknown function (DU1801)